MKNIEKIFSVKNIHNHKVITFFGIKFKFKNKLKMLENRILELEKENYREKTAKKSLSLALDTISEQNNNLKCDNEKIQKRVKTLEGEKSRILKRLNFLTREKNTANWRFNYLIEKLKCEDVKDIVLQHRFFYEGNEYVLDIENPKTFNEKIQWLRKYYLLDNPLTDMISDKLLFKKYIAEKLGEGYTIKTIQEWEDPRKIDWTQLPDKFVLKSNWGGDGSQVMIVKDKLKLDIPSITNKISEWAFSFNQPYYNAFTPIFKNIKPFIFAEEYVEGLGTEFFDYKVFCFNGKPKLVYVATNWAQGIHKMSYYDTEWNKLDLVYSNYAHFDTPRPQNLEKMLEIATKLSQDFPFVRIDFFDLKERVVLSEMTFTPGGGFGNYKPVDWDYKMGEMLDISHLMEKKDV